MAKPGMVTVGFGRQNRVLDCRQSAFRDIDQRTRPTGQCAGSHWFEIVGNMWRKVTTVASAALAISIASEAKAFEKTGVKWCDEMLDRYVLCLRSVTYEKCESIAKARNWPALADYPLSTVAAWCLQEAADLIIESDDAFSANFQNRATDSVKFCEAFRPRIAQNLRTYLCEK